MWTQDVIGCRYWQNWVIRGGDGHSFKKRKEEQRKREMALLLETFSVAVIMRKHDGLFHTTPTVIL